MQMIDVSQYMKLLPYSLTHDEVIVSMFEAAGIQLREAYDDAAAVYDLVQVDKLPERLLDLIAYEKHVDFYDNQLSLKQKQDLVQKSISWHRKKGTPWAVKTAISTLNSKAEVFEWFEYGGAKYFFKVQLSLDDYFSRDFDISRLKRLIDETKNKRSWLDGIILNGNVLNKIFIVNNSITRIHLKTASNPWAFAGGIGDGVEKILLNGKYLLNGERFLNSFVKTNGPAYLSDIRLVLKVNHDFGVHEINLMPLVDGEFNLDGEILLQNEAQSVNLPVLQEAILRYKQREVINIKPIIKTPTLCKSESMSGVVTLNGQVSLDNSISLNQALLENSGLFRVVKNGITVEEVAM